MEKYFSKVLPCIQEPTYAYRAKTQFFEDNEPPEQEVSVKEANFEEITEFYEKIKQHHASDDLESNIPVQHPKLRAVLRSYQTKGTQWMLQREQKTMYLPTEFIKISSKRDPEKVFYFNERTRELYDAELSSNFPIPSGGILADEMG